MYDDDGAKLMGTGFAPNSFTMTFPRKIFSKGVDFGQSLKEAGMAPSCALIVG